MLSEKMKILTLNLRTTKYTNKQTDHEQDDSL